MDETGEPVQTSISSALHTSSLFGRVVRGGHFWCWKIWKLLENKLWSGLLVVASCSVLAFFFFSWRNWKATWINQIVEANLLRSARHQQLGWNCVFQQGSELTQSTGQKLQRNGLKKKERFCFVIQLEICVMPWTFAGQQHPSGHLAETLCWGTKENGNLKDKYPNNSNLLMKGQLIQRGSMLSV